MLVDPIRHLRLFDIKFDFWTMKRTTPELDIVTCFLGSQDQEKQSEKQQPHRDDEGFLYEKSPGEEKALVRFARALSQLSGTPVAQSPVALVKMAIGQLMHEDLSRVLFNMSRTLDQIELAIDNDDLLRRSIPMWRTQLGRWRNSMFHQSNSFRPWLQTLTANLPQPSGSPMTTSTQMTQVNTRLQHLGEDLDTTIRRIETTFHVLMSSMSIVESERAINEAETVSKLTHLAFFFIPLTLVAGVFGMNIKASTTIRIAHAELSKLTIFFRNGRTKSPGGTGFWPLFSSAGQPI